MKNEKINGYKLTKMWFDYAENNASEITPYHGIVYLWLVELNNRCNWIHNFQVPTVYSMSVCGIRSYNTYKKILSDLVTWGFISITKKAVNQYQAKEIALSFNDTADISALSTDDTPALSLDDTPNQFALSSGDTILNNKKKTIKQGGDFIDSVIDIYTEKFPDTTGAHEGKNRSAVGDLLKHWKEKHPGQTTEETIAGLREFFGKCAMITVPWYKTNMSLSTIASKFTEINRMISVPGRTPDRAPICQDGNFKDITK